MLIKKYIEYIEYIEYIYVKVIKMTITNDHE